MSSDAGVVISSEDVERYQRDGAVLLRGAGGRKEAVDVTGPLVVELEGRDGRTRVSAELLNENAAPTAEQIRDAIAGNLCMCTGYVELPVSSRSDSPGFSRLPDWFR
jgi:hypothetical protein